MSQPRTTKAEKAEALGRLREWVKPGDTLFTVLRHVSASGMMRVIDVIQIDAKELDRDGAPTIGHLSWNMAKALGETIDREREGLRVRGGGMDMGFHLVMNLGYALFPDGFGCTGERCPSNDHSNGDRDHMPNVEAHWPDGSTTQTHWHRSGGFALRHRWI